MSYLYDEPTTDELRQRLAAVLRNIAPYVALRILSRAGVMCESSWFDLKWGNVPLGMSDAELQQWLAALTKPLETAR